MGSFFIRGIIIGLLFGLPAGAVGAMTAQRTLKFGLKAGLLTGLGSSVADCFYACIGACGLTLISDFLLKYQGVIHLAGGILILVMGIHMIWAKENQVQSVSGSAGGFRMFLSSFSVGITNPAAILTFLFAFSYFGITGRCGMPEGLSLVCGVFIGTYIWWGTLSGLVTLLKKKAKKKHLQNMNRLFGSVLVLFGVVILSSCGTKTDRDEKTVPDVRSSLTEESSTKKNEEEPREEPMTEAASETGHIENAAETGGAQVRTMAIEVGGQNFQVTLYDNNTVRALEERLPMTLDMEELHGNEKFCYLDEALPTEAQDVGTIKTGDLMLFGSDCLVLFFQEFNTSYSYTKIGHIDDTKRFTESLESGTVKVSLSTGE